MKNNIKKLTAFAVLLLGTSIAQPSMFSKVAQKFADYRIYKTYINPQTHSRIETSFSHLIQDAKQQNNLQRLPERVTNLAYDYTSTVKSFNKKINKNARDKKYLGCIAALFASSTAYLLTTNDNKTENARFTGKNSPQRTFAALSAQSNHIEY